MRIIISLLAVFAMLLPSVACAEPVHAPKGKQLKVQWAVLQSKEGKMAEMGAIGARTVAPYTAQEPGSYSLYGAVAKENPNLMRLLEIYEDEAAYQVHRSSEGFKQYQEQRAPILEKLILLPVDPIVLEQKAEGQGGVVTMTLVEVRPESLEDFRALVTAEMPRAVAEDAGVLGLFATAEQGERKNRIHTLEIFRDEEARRMYLNSKPYGEYRKKADAMLASRRVFENFPARITLSAKGLHNGMKKEMGSMSEFQESDPEFAAFFGAFAMDEVTRQGNLDAPTRYKAILAALLGCQGVDEFRAVLPAALDNGVTPAEAKEIIYQATAYLGIGRVRPFLTAANDVMKRLGIALPLPGGSTTTPESRLEAGAQAQVDIFGDGMKDFYKSGPEETRHINRWLADNCFGDYYTRRGLDYGQREMITFCFLSAQGGCEPQLTAHAKGNMAVGNDKAFLIDVISQCLPYIGYPRSLNALQCVNRAAAEFSK